MLNKIKKIIKKTFEFIMKLYKKIKSLIILTAKFLINLPCNIKSPIKKTIIFLREADYKTKIKIIIGIVLVIYLYDSARNLYVEHKFGKFEIVEMPNKECVEEIISVNDKLAFVLADDKYWILDLNTNKIEKEDCKELRDYIIIFRLDDNRLIVENLNEPYTKNDETYYKYYIYDIKTKKFTKLDADFLDGGKKLWFNNTKCLHFVYTHSQYECSDDIPAGFEKCTNMEKGYYEICNIDTQKCRYGGDTYLSSYDFTRLGNKTYIKTYQDSYIFDTDTNTLDKIKAEPYPGDYFYACGDNLICFYDELGNFSLVITVDIYIEKYKLEDNELKFVEKLKTNLHQSKPSILPFGPSNRYALVMGGHYGGYPFFPEIPSIRTYFLDTKTGKTYKYRDLPYDEQIDWTRLNKNKWAIYKHYQGTYYTDKEKIVIFTQAKKQRI